MDFLQSQENTGRGKDHWTPGTQKIYKKKVTLIWKQRSPCHHYTVLRLTTAGQRTVPRMHAFMQPNANPICTTDPNNIHSSLAREQITFILWNTKSGLFKYWIYQWQGRNVMWVQAIQDQEPSNLDSNWLTGKRIVEMQRTIFHQVKAQTLEPLPWILSWCLSPISSSFHHCNKLLVTNTTILKIYMQITMRQVEIDNLLYHFKLLWFALALFGWFKIA